MTKEQLEKGNKLTSRIKDVKSKIEMIDDPIDVVCISTRRDGCRNVNLSIGFNSNGVIMNPSGIYDDIFLSKLEMLTRGYIESTNEVLKNQLDSLERQLREL